jgi:hypothetical protein
MAAMQLTHVQAAACDNRRQATSRHEGNTIAGDWFRSFARDQEMVRCDAKCEHAKTGGSLKGD